MKKSLFFMPAVLLVCIFLCSCSGCETEERTGFTIASWNVQNLFDGVNDGTEYSEYRHSAGWSDSAYRARLAALVQVLDSGDLAKAEIIVLNEIENARVAEDIMSALGNRSFLWYAVASQEDGPISLGIISSVPMISADIHEVDGARPVIRARFRICDTDVFVLAVHAKSNLGDTEENLFLRSLLGQAVDDLVRRTRQDFPGSLVILAGDFNEEPWTGNVVRNPDLWRCFWEDRRDELTGSYVYDGQWLCYDNILLSADFLQDWGVVTDGIATDRDGRPNAWNRNTLSGVSDHLPVWVRVRLI